MLEKSCKVFGGVTSHANKTEKKETTRLVCYLEVSANADCGLPISTPRVWIREFFKGGGG